MGLLLRMPTTRPTAVKSSDRSPSRRRPMRQVRSTPSAGRDRGDAQTCELAGAYQTRSPGKSVGPNAFGGAAVERGAP